MCNMSISGPKIIICEMLIHEIVLHFKFINVFNINSTTVVSSSGEKIRAGEVAQ